MNHASSETPITSFQQFFSSSPPPQLFNNTPKNNIKLQRSYSNNSKCSKDASPYSSLNDTKRKSQSLLRSGTANFKEIEEQNVKISARFRPLNQNENSYNSIRCIQYMDDRTVCIEENKQYYTFDQVFSESTNQLQIYQQIGLPIVKDALNGINGTIIAYGQTGSGKTYTMFGNQENQGIVYRTLNDLIKEAKSTISISMLEVYKENIFDLLGGTQKELKIKEDSSLGFYVERLQKIQIENKSQAEELIKYAENNRHVSDTKVNQQSSRSHLVMMIFLTDNFGKLKAKLNLVDLAGSEKVAKTGAVGGTLEEAKKINSSLSCLGHVISCLSQELDHIPYRDSKLTRLLQDSLQGNCKTSIIVTCSPHISSVDETISSLKFAQRAKMIKPQIKIHKRSYKDLESEISLLRQELEITKSQLENANSNNNNSKISTEELHKKRNDKLDTQESDIQFLGIDSTKPSNRSFQFHDEKQRGKLNVHICLYEVQSKMSYLLNGFSAFIKDFQLSEIQALQSRKIVNQFLDLNQSFQTLSMIVKQDEQKYQMKQQIAEQKNSSELTFNIQVNRVQENIRFITHENSRSGKTNEINENESLEMDLDYQYKYSKKSQTTDESQDLKGGEIKRFDLKTSEFKENFPQQQSSKIITKAKRSTSKQPKDNVQISASYKYLKQLNKFKQGK